MYKKEYVNAFEVYGDSTDYGFEEHENYNKVVSSKED